MSDLKLPRSGYFLRILDGIVNKESYINYIGSKFESSRLHHVVLGFPGKREERCISALPLVPGNGLLWIW